MKVEQYSAEAESATTKTREHTRKWLLIALVNVVNVVNLVNLANMVNLVILLNLAILEILAILIIPAILKLAILVKLEIAVNIADSASAEYCSTFTFPSVRPSVTGVTSQLFLII